MEADRCVTVYSLSSRSVLAPLLTETCSTTWCSFLLSPASGSSGLQSEHDGWSSGGPTTMHALRSARRIPHS